MKCARRARRLAIGFAVLFVAVAVRAVANQRQEAQRGGEVPASPADMVVVAQVATEAGALAPAELETFVAEELDRLRTTVAFPLRYELSEEEQATRPDPKKLSIIVSGPQLRKILAQAGVAQPRDIIRLLLAHELAHVAQFHQYGPRTIADALEPTKRLYECQADVLAGKMLIESLPQPHLQPNQNQIILDALDVMFRLGLEAKPLAPHPTREQRRNAVRRGMIAGTIVKMQQHPDPLLVQPRAMLTHKIDIRVGEEPWLWSFRQAKRIVHYQADVGAKIKVSRPQVVKHDVPPFFPWDVSVTLTNPTDQTVRGDFELRCDLVDPNDQEGKARQLWSARSFRATFEPGDHRTFTARLATSGPPDMFPPAMIAREPELVVPPDPDKALWSFVAIDTAKPNRKVDRAKDLAASLFAGRTMDVHQTFKPQLQLQIPPHQLTRMIQILQAKAGGLKKIAGSEIAELAEVTVVDLYCVCERGEVDVRFYLDTQGRVAGLWAVPAEQDPG